MSKRSFDPNDYMSNPLTKLKRIVDELDAVANSAAPLEALRNTLNDIAGYEAVGFAPGPLLSSSNTVSRALAYEDHRFLVRPVRVETGGSWRLEFAHYRVRKGEREAVRPNLEWDHGLPRALHYLPNNPFNNFPRPSQVVCYGSPGSWAWAFPSDIQPRGIHRSPEIEDAVLFGHGFVYFGMGLPMGRLEFPDLQQWALDSAVTVALGKPMLVDARLTSGDDYQIFRKIIQL